MVAQVDSRESVDRRGALDALGAGAYLDAMTVAARVLEDHAVALDHLDRPDGAADAATGAPGVGSDLAATLSSAVQSAEGCTDFASICTALERGARAGCTGRAGRGTASLLCGIGEVLRNADRLDAQRFALALEAGAELLAPGDDGRHPGGFEAVVSVVADAALAAADRQAVLGEVILSAATAGIEELERGPEADARLAARGTVDAAAAGLLLVLDTLASVVTGEPVPRRPVTTDVRIDAPPEVLRYEVRCRLIPDDPGVEVAAHLESLLVEMADVTTWEVGGDAWSVGLHTPLPGTAVEALAEIGVLRELHIGLLGASSATGPDGSVIDALAGTTG